jgi:hypothetical protein
MLFYLGGLLLIKAPYQSINEEIKHEMYHWTRQSWKKVPGNTP